MATAEVSRNRLWWARSRAWLGIIIIAPFAAAGLFSVPLAGADTWQHCVLECVGWLAFVSGVIVRWWATLYIGGRKNQMLVSEGPYSICRNPLYVGTFLMGLAIGLFLGSATFLAGFAVASVFYLSVTVPVEEENLRRIIGDRFDEYCRTTPRFWPNFRLLVSPRHIEVDTHGLMAETWRRGAYLWIPAICELIAYARNEAWWPHNWQLP